MVTSNSFRRSLLLSLLASSTLEEKLAVDTGTHEVSEYAIHYGYDYDVSCMFRRSKADVSTDDALQTRLDGTCR